MKIQVRTAMLFLTAIAFAACAGENERSNQSALADSDTVTFFAKAASAGKLEIESGRLATQKATDPRLKAFGQKMVVDHTKASQELQALAARKNVRLPAMMSDDDERKLAKLREVSTGKDFDSEYRDLMVDSHDEAVALFEDTAESSKDVDVKRFAAKMLPTLQHHEQQANALPKS